MKKSFYLALLKLSSTSTSLKLIRKRPRFLSRQRHGTEDVLRMPDAEAVRRGVVLRVSLDRVSSVKIERC